MVTATRAVARPTNDDLNLASARCWRDDENKSLHHCPPRISAMTAPTAEETAAALCDDVAAAIHPDLGVLGDNADRVRAVADGMLARLDELDAMLRSLRDDGAEQRAALEPALEALAGGLARDFAYVDSVEDTVRDVGNAVGAMEERLSALEQGRFRRARVADAENARASIESLFAKMGGGDGVDRGARGGRRGGGGRRGRGRGGAVARARERGGERGERRRRSRGVLGELI